MTVTGPKFFGPTGATGPTGPTGTTSHRDSHYLLTRAKIELTGASDAMIRSKFYEVFNEFLSESSLWQERITGEIFPHTVEYWVEPQETPAGVILLLDSVCDRIGVPIPAAMPKRGFVHLQCAPTTEQTVHIYVTKTCAIPHDNDMPQVPWWVINQYEVYLLSGVLSKMQLQKGRSYSDPILGRENYTQFRNGVAIARSNALHKNTFGRNAWSYPQQMRTTSQRGGVSVGSNYREF